MSRKHFQALADALRSIRPNSGDEGYQGWREAVEAVATVCRSTNERFDRERFYEAAGRDAR